MNAASTLGAILSKNSKKRISPLSALQMSTRYSANDCNDVRGERLLPDMSSAYVAVGLMIIAGFTGNGLSIAPLAVAAGDIAVLAAIYATLRGEISRYVDWRRNDDPNYAAEIE